MADDEYADGDKDHDDEDATDQWQQHAELWGNNFSIHSSLLEFFNLIRAVGALSMFAVRIAIFSFFYFFCVWSHVIRKWRDGVGILMRDVPLN